MLALSLHATARTCAVTLLLTFAAVQLALAYDAPLGPPNLDRYCKETYGRLFAVAKLGPNAGDWVCQSNRVNRSIDVRAACVLFNKGDDYVTKAWFDGKSWQCKWVLSEQKVDLDLYCKGHFTNQFKAVLHGATSFDWACQRGTNAADRRAINVDAACKEQWPYNAFYKSLPYGTNSWRCIVFPTKP